MAQAVTYAELLRRAKSAADMTYSDFWSSTQWLDQINTSTRKLYNKLCEADQDFYTVARYIELDGSNRIYRLPLDFYKLRGVDYLVGSRQTPMKKFTFQDRYLYSDAPPAQTVTLWIVPTFTAFDGTTTQEFDAINGWDQYVVLDAAIQALIAEESDPSGLITERSIMEAELEAMKGDRDIGTPERVGDVTLPMFFGPRVAYRIVNNYIHFGQATGEAYDADY